MKNPLKNFGGWLRALAIWFVFAPIWLVIRILSVMDKMDRIHYHYGDSYYWGFQIETLDKFFIFDMVVKGLLILLLIFTAYLFFKRSENFPPLASFFLIVATFLAIIESLVPTITHWNTYGEFLDTLVFVNFVRMSGVVGYIIASVLWFTCLKKSSRIKETFVY